jgi:hypothetical protein
MDISAIMSSTTGIYLVSIVLGFGLATLMTGTCQGAFCTVLRAPDPKTYAHDSFSFGGKCWTYNTAATSCNATQAVIDYA